MMGKNLFKIVRQFNFKTEDSLGHSYYFEVSELINNADIIIIVSQQTP